MKIDDIKLVDLGISGFVKQSISAVLMLLNAGEGATRPSALSIQNDSFSYRKRDGYT